MITLSIKRWGIIFFIVCCTALALLSGNYVCIAEEAVRGTQSTSSSQQQDGMQTQTSGIINYSSYANYFNTLPSTIRTQSWYKKDAQTTPLGGTATQWSYGPDIGWGETGKGFTYTDPIMGATISYSITGFGMGTVAAPLYGGAQSIFGQGTYGPLWETAATGKAPVTSPTYGWSTQTSQAGSLFGTGYTYTYAQPDYALLLAAQLAKNPSTQSLGNTLLALSTLNWLNTSTAYSYQPYYWFPTASTYGTRWW
ncbi:MAG: hypothetical protein ACMUIP_08265 [bacterium]